MEGRQGHPLWLWSTRTDWDTMSIIHSPSILEDQGPDSRGSSSLLWQLSPSPWRPRTSRSLCEMHSGACSQDDVCMVRQEVLGAAEASGAEHGNMVAKTALYTVLKAKWQDPREHQTSTGWLNKQSTWRKQRRAVREWWETKVWSIMEAKRGDSPTDTWGTNSDYWTLQRSPWYKAWKHLLCTWSKDIPKEKLGRAVSTERRKQRRGFKGLRSQWKVRMDTRSVGLPHSANKNTGCTVKFEFIWIWMSGNQWVTFFV